MIFEIVFDDDPGISMIVVMFPCFIYFDFLLTELVLIFLRCGLTPHKTHDMLRSVCI